MEFSASPFYMRKPTARYIPSIIIYTCMAEMEHVLGINEVVLNIDLFIEHAPRCDRIVSL